MRSAINATNLKACAIRLRFYNDLTRKFGFDFSYLYCLRGFRSQLSDPPRLLRAVPIVYEEGVGLGLLVLVFLTIAVLIGLSGFVGSIGASPIASNS